MIILWIRKNKAEKQNLIDGQMSFQEHDDIMKKFRMAHPDLNLTTSKDIATPEGNLLAPIDQVKLAVNTQN